MNFALRFFLFWDKFIEKSATALVVVAVFLMISLSALAIILRWMETSFLWIAPFVRHLVFMTAFLGGVLATGKKRHISIDIINKFFENRGHLKIQRWQSRFIDLICLGVLLWLTKAGWSFTQVELQYGHEAFLGIHSGYLVGMIPIGLALMAYRFFFLFVSSFTSLKEERS